METEIKEKENLNIDHDFTIYTAMTSSHHAYTHINIIIGIRGKQQRNNS